MHSCFCRKRGSKKQHQNLKLAGLGLVLNITKYVDRNVHKLLSCSKRAAVSSNSCLVTLEVLALHSLHPFSFTYSHPSSPIIHELCIHEIILKKMERPWNFFICQICCKNSRRSGVCMYSNSYSTTSTYFYLVSYLSKVNCM